MCLYEAFYLEKTCGANEKASEDVALKALFLTFITPLITLICITVKNLINL